MRDREFGGEQKAMADAWGVHGSTLSRWLRGDRVPESTWYGLLGDKLGIPVDEVHAACQVERGGRARTKARRIKWQ